MIKFLGSVRVVLFFGVILEPGALGPVVYNTPWHHPFRTPWDGETREDGIAVFPVGEVRAPRTATSYAVALAYTVRRSEEGCALVVGPLGLTFTPLRLNAGAEIMDFLVKYDLAHRVDRTASKLGGAEWLVASVLD